MKYLKSFEISIHNQKQNLEREIFNFLQFLKTEYYIGQIVIDKDKDSVFLAYDKNNKIDSITSNNITSNNMVVVTISTLKGKNKTNNFLVNICTLVEMNKLFEYLIKRFDVAYDEYLISIDTNKYNL